MKKLFFISILWGLDIFAKPLVIAHRGASGYLPEHTAEAIALAFGMDADYIEPDLIGTKDHHIVVFHDLYLNETTNVQELFPGRQRQDGNYYVIDFTLEELKKLDVFERINPKNGELRYKGRFPLKTRIFKILSFEEYLELFIGLNFSLNKKVGIFAEIKDPDYHLKYGVDLVKETMRILESYKFNDENAPIYIESFEASALQRVHFEFKSPIKLVQLIGENSWGDATCDQDALKTQKGLAEIKKYAVGIAPHLPHLWVKGKNRELKASPLLQRAKTMGLKIFSYTARKDDLPIEFPNFESMLNFYYNVLKIDGLFTDFPDLAKGFINQHAH